MIKKDKFYTIKTNKGFINGALYCDPTDNPLHAVMFYSRGDVNIIVTN